MSFVKKNRLFSQIFTTGILRGGVKFPTGGTAREPHKRCARMIRCKSGADSIVWMREGCIFICISGAPDRKVRGFLLRTGCRSGHETPV